MKNSQTSENSTQNTLFLKKTNSNNSVATVEALTYLYRVFHIVGIYATKKYKYAYYCYSLILNGSVTVFLPIAFMASYFVESNKGLDIGTLLTSIQVVYNVFGSSIKIWMLIILIPKLKTGEEVMAKLDARCIAEDEVDLLHKIKKLGRTIVIFYAIVYWSYSTSTFITSVLAGHPPYSVYLPYIDWRHSKREFIVASLIEFVLMDLACFQQIANDSYGAVYISVLRAHLNIIRLRIRKLSTNPEKSLDENFEELKMCIIDHKDLIKLYEIISPVIATTIFLQFTLTAAILGTSLINLLIFSTTVSAVIASCIYILAVCVEIFPVCYFSTCLFYDSDDLAQEIFHSSWIHQSPRYRKMLIFFMQRSQQSMIMMAGKIFPINLNSFISIAKFSFTLYTFIKKMGIKERLGLE